MGKDFPLKTVQGIKKLFFGIIIINSLALAVSDAVWIFRHSPISEKKV